MAKAKAPAKQPGVIDPSVQTRYNGLPLNGSGRINGHDPSTILAPSMDLPNQGGGLDTIIQPLVHDRWLGLIRRNYDAQSVRSVLEGTYTGAPLFHQMNLLEMLEETWPRVGKNLHDIRSEVARAEWVVAPYAQKGEKATASAQEKAKFVESKIWEMKGNPNISQNDFTDTVYDLMDAYGKGVAVLEIDWNPVRKNGEFAPLGTRWIRSNYYNQAIAPEELDRLKLSPSGRPLTDLQDFPPNKFITGIYRARSNPHSGKVAMLRSLAPWWVFTNFSTEWLLQFGQIFGMPIRWANYASPKDLPVISKMLENMGAVSWGAFPANTKLELHESTQAASNNPNAYLLEYSDKLADITILGQTLTSDVEKKTGSRALGEVHERILTGRKRHAAMWAGATLTNQLSASIIRLNYGNDEEVPVIIADVIRQTDPNLMAQRDKILFVDMGLPVSLEYLYSEHGIPEPEKDDELFEPPVKPVAGAFGAAGQIGTGKKKNRTGENGFRNGNTKGKRGSGSRSAPSKTVPNTPRAKAFSALEEINLAEGVIEALEDISDDAEAIRWIETLVSAVAYQGEHYRKGQPGGGWFMKRSVLNAMNTVQDTMKAWPPEGQHRSRRYIKAFGLPDNESEFRAYMAPGMADMVDKRAREIKCTEVVSISGLKTTQSNLDGEKIMGMLMSTMDDSTQPVPRSPIVVKRGNKQWLWDGHHRVAKAVALKKDTFNARVIDMEDYTYNGSAK